MQIATFVMLSLLVAQTADPAQEATGELLRGMRQRAEETRVASVIDGKAVPAKLLAEPLFRYSDQPRDIVDATFWGWHDKGRPVAFQKVEVYRRKEGLHYFYCFASATDRLIETTWKVGEQWKANQPGVVWRTLPGGPQIAGTDARRLLQMRRLARGFSVTSYDDIAKTQEELRFLSQPIYQYGKPMKGVVFGFAGNGTNPDALLLIQLNDDNKRWEYGCLKMTTARIIARHNKQIVWTAPYHTPNPARPSKFDTWLFFNESAASGVAIGR